MRLDVEGCAHLLHVSTGEVRDWIRRKEFAEPNGMAAGQPFWSERRVLRWLVRGDPAGGERVPIEYWPPAPQPAPYLGAETVHQVGVGLRWRTPQGVVYLFFHHQEWEHGTLELAQHRLAGQAAAIVKVDPDYSHDGPSLSAICPAAPQRVYWPSWTQLSQVLGGPIPFWPAGVRTADLITRWRPEAAPLVVPACPAVDVVPALRLAVAVEPGFIRDTLINMVQIIQQQATDAALLDLEMFQQRAEPRTYIIAAEPMATLSADRDDIPESQRRATWLELLSRSDTLTGQCVRLARRWDGGKDLPAPEVLRVDPEAPAAREWTARLVPCRRTAMFEMVDPEQEAAATLLDPLTDAPAARVGERIHAAIPHRLTTSAPLAEIILEEPIWVRTSDGVIFPAPRHPGFGIGWGNIGRGATALALLIHQLLHDITTVPQPPAGAPSGLLALTARPWPTGTVLTREQLQQALDTPREDI
ncbi:hypothetical protein [Nonomuraea sp. NPDC049129]|uniref:hypothetical protein n=1 Tax=Nonomuraea sp. NPDC049129 TaxID=3155272 RepID=UPI0033C3E23E